MDDRHFFVDHILSWGRNNLRSFPWRRDGATLYGILVAEMLLRKTTSSQVSSVYPEFLARFPNSEALQAAPSDAVRETVRSLGLHKQRAAALKGVADYICEWGEPRDYDDIVSMPHVGQYIAGAVSCFALGERRPIVDTNVIRLYSRFFGLSGAKDNRRNHQVRGLADETLPEDDYVLFNYSILDFAASICTGRGKPRCTSCPLAERCEYTKASQAESAGLEDSAPSSRKNKSVTLDKSK